MLAHEEALHVHAYVMMANHVHLLATGDRSDSLSRTFQRLGRLYVQYFNYMYARTGTLWEGRFRSTLVEEERYLFACQRYIELNPVRAGIVATPGEFAWSSHRYFAMGSADDLVTPHPIIEGLGSDAASRRRTYLAEFGSPVSEDLLARIRESVNRGWALGSPEFCARLDRCGSRRSIPLPRGKRARASLA